MVNFLEELKDGQYKWWFIFSGGVAKGGKIFGVNGFDDFLDEGPLEK